MDQESVQNNDTKDADGNPHKRYPWLCDPEYKEKAIARYKEREAAEAEARAARARPHQYVWANLPKRKGE